MRKHHVSTILTILLLLSAASSYAAQGPDPWGGKSALVEIRLERFEAEFPVFYEGDYDVAGWDTVRSVVGLVVDHAGWEALITKGYRPTLIADSEPSRVDPGYFDYEEIMERLGEV